MRKFDRSKKHYSVSQLLMFAMCRRKYYNIYIERIPMYPLYVLESGKAAHAALEESNLDLIEGKKSMTPEQALACAVENFKIQIEGKEGLDVEEDEGVDKLVKDVSGPLEKYLLETQNNIIEMDGGITSAEEEIVTELGGQPFIGYVDMTTPSMVFDYKLMARRKSAAQINNSLQLVVYEKAVKKQGGFVQLLRKKKLAEIALPQRAEKTTHKIYSWGENVVKTIEQCRKTGDFLKCDPTNWMCSNCQFNQFCFNL